MTLRVGLDATPLLGRRTGVGQYVAGLVGAFQADPDGPQLTLTPFTWRGTGDLDPALAAGPRTTLTRRRVPARALREAWARGQFPPVEWLAGHLDVFHATNFVAPPARRAAVAVTVHDLTYLHHPELVSAASARYRALVPRSVARAAVVCTPTAAVAAAVGDAYGVPADRRAVTPLGVSAAYLGAAPPGPAWLAERGLPASYLLFVGSLEPRKNLPVLLDAYRELAAADPEVPPLVLAGPPGWGPALDTTGLPPGQVRTTGYLTDAELVGVTAGAAALAFPSRYEGFGLPPLEALACGVPAVVSDLPVLREVLGGHATYVPVGDAAALAGALAKTLSDPGDARTRAARRAHAARFTWARCAQATLEAYQQALA